VVRFFRQVSHDLRNQLNAVELQSAFISELTTDPELKEEIGRLRKMISDCGNALQKLSTRLNPPSPNLTAYAAGDLVDDLKARIGKEFPSQAQSVEWTDDAKDAQVSVDPQLLQEALLELFRNAFEHQAAGSSLVFHARTEGDSLVLTLYEPKAEFNLATEKWGREPLRNVNRGHYGLGLNRARTIVEGHDGKLRAQHDSTQSRLITSIALPLARSGR
jgi:K+-sensing histidine kinase KdpD